jgi:hypothetical protein
MLLKSRVVSMPPATAPVSAPAATSATLGVRLGFFEMIPSAERPSVPATAASAPAAPPASASSGGDMRDGERGAIVAGAKIQGE